MPKKKEQAEVYLYCPECKKDVKVRAKMTYLNRAYANVLYYADGHCGIDWDNLDIAGDFEYRCTICGERLARDLDEVTRRFREEQKKGKKK